MLRKTIVTLFFLVSFFLLQSNAQPPTLVERLGVVGSTVHLEVRTIIKGSAADKGGVRPGDQLMIFDARPLATGEDMLRVIGSAAPGEHELTVLRDGKVKQIGVKLGPPGAGRLGLAFVSGVRVVGMLKGSLAMRAGLQKDDLVTSIRLNDKVLPTPTVEELERSVAAIPASQPFDIVYSHQDMVVTQTILLAGTPPTEASASSQGQATPATPTRALPTVQTPPQQNPSTSRGTEAGNRGQSAGGAPRPPYQRPNVAVGGERQGDYVTPPRETEAAPARGGRDSVANSPSDATRSRLAAREARMRLSGARGSGAAAPQRSATLDQMLVKTNYAPPASVARRMTEINVLSYVYIDKNTGEAVFVGRYDPTYATGPIDYTALLADAIENPYPRFTLEYPGGNGRSPMAQMRSTLDAEFDHISRDPNYGVEWLGKLVLPVIKGESPDPDQQAALNAKLRASGITPESYRAYMKWQLGHFEDMQAYSEGAGEFLPAMMQAVGLSRKTGEEITAYRLFASQGNRQNLDNWCAVSGYTDLENKIVEEIRATGNQNLASMELLPALYGSILRGLGVPEGQLSQILSQYKSSGNEGLLVSPLEERYQAIFKQVLMDKVVNGMTFTGTTLSRQYGFAPIMSPLNTYGARRDSPVMNVFFNADYILKFMTSSPRPAESMPEHQTSQAFLTAAENRAGSSAGRTPKSGVIRYWLYPQSVGMDALSGNSGVHFREASVRVGAEALESEGADRTGMDFQKTALDQYSNNLTSLYDRYAKLYPALHTLRETEKVVALARWAQKNSVRIRAAAGNAPRQTLPDTVQGFWGMTYIVRPTGDTDTMVTWAQGGVDFGQSAGDGWMQSGPPSREVTDDALRSLAASTALSEKAAMAAKDGDLESARDLAQRGAEAMSGNIDFTNVPQVPMPAMPEPDPASAAAVSEASVEAVDMNVAGLKEARQNLAKSETLGASDPAQAEQLRQQSQELKSRSEENLTRLQTMLQEYRNSPANGYQVAVDLRGLDPNQPATVAVLHPAPPQPPQNTIPAVAPQPKNECSPDVERALPSREELLIELATRRIQLDGLKNTLVRFNRTIQMDQKQYAEWEGEASKAVDRITERRDAMIQDATFNCLTEVLKIRLDKDKTLSDAARKDQERKLQLLKNLKTFNDYKEWALSHKDDWEMMDQGFRQLLEFLPLDENPGLSIGVHSAEALVDGAYDVADFYGTWSNLKQLDHNSDQYLAIVKRNGEKMKALVTSIKDLEVQLDATPERPANTTYCKAAAAR